MDTDFKTNQPTGVIRGSFFGGLLYSRPAIAGADTPSIRLARSISSIGLAPKSRLNSRLNWEELADLYTSSSGAGPCPAAAARPQPYREAGEKRDPHEEATEALHAGTKGPVSELLTSPRHSGRFTKMA